MKKQSSIKFPAILLNENLSWKEHLKLMENNISKNIGLIFKSKSIYLFHDGGHYHIETSPLICRANQWTGFYIITASVMKELNKDSLWALYFSYIHSYINYVNLVLRSTHRTYLRKVNSHQKHILRLIHNKNRFYHSK